MPLEVEEEKQEEGKISTRFFLRQNNRPFYLLFITIAESIVIHSSLFVSCWIGELVFVTEMQCDIYCIYSTKAFRDAPIALDQCKPTLVGFEKMYYLILYH